jgi:galactokinase
MRDAQRAAAAAWFRECYGTDPAGVWHAPGRVNLIGEHTDYNDGFVLPFALAQGVRAAAGRRDDGVLELRSRQAPGEAVRAEVRLPAPGSIPDNPAQADARPPARGSIPDNPAQADLRPPARGSIPDNPAQADGRPLAPGSIPGWAGYAAGMTWSLLEAGHAIGGARVAIDSDLPQGAGLSSSAALECATAMALTGLYGLSIGPAELARLARRAENDFVGAPTGIMDQSASLQCIRGYALLLDCRSLATAQVPLDVTAAGLDLLVLDTGVRHRHAGGAYADRRRACEQAAALLGVPALRDVTDLGMLDNLADPVLRRRARHVITDNERVMAVADLLRSGAVCAVGPLLTQAHRSLRDDFEVSWPEADVAVDSAVAAGALGARMIGGGFGGSVLALVPAGRPASVAAAVGGEFARRGWPAPAVVPASAQAGASLMA